MNTRLVVEEIVAGALVPCMEKHIGSVVGLRVDAGEGGQKVIIEVDHRDLPDGVDPFGGDVNEMTKGILENRVQEKTNPMAGVTRFTLKDAG